MMLPRTPAEFECVLNKLVDQGVFGSFPAQAVRDAIQEVARAIEGAYVGESTPTPCQRLAALQFIATIEHFVTEEPTESNLVTIEET